MCWNRLESVFEGIVECVVAGKVGMSCDNSSAASSRPT